MTIGHHTPAKPATTFKINLPITHQTLADLMATLIESGDPVTNSWLKKVSPAHPDLLKVVTEGPWYSDPKFWDQSGLCIKVECDKATMQDTGERAVTMNDLRRGFALLATDKDGAYAQHLADIMSENTDAGTADIFMQMVVYGGEVYA